MKHRFLMMTLIAIAALSLMALPVAAQQAPKPGSTATASKNWTPPKTSWGDPDLQGIYTSDDYIGLGMNRQQQYGNRLYFTDQEIAARETTIQNTAQRDAEEFANPNGNVGTGPPGHWGERARRSPRQTSLIIEPENGQTPALTEEGRARQAMYTRQGAGTANPEDSWEGYTYYIRCITRGIAGSIIPVIYGNGTEIVQGPGYVVLLQEMVHEARVIPLDGSPHVGSNIKTYMGDSRGHWEGNTLVIETTNILGNKTGIGGNGGAGAPFSEDAKFTERLIRTDKETIQYSMRVEDPRTYTAPFTFSFPIRKEPGYQNFEYACHEGNNGMMNQLSGARAAEKAAAEAAKQK
jgi:hypothetical protein